jgi:hypothetical protein
VAVMLRYTLRLLTLDQLGRAATLICALEELRNATRSCSATRASPWASGSGRARRPTAQGGARTLSTSPRPHESPFPLTTCPWCGEDIKIQNIKLVDDEGKPSKTKYTRAVVYCDGSQAASSPSARRPGQGLPVLFVDEQIYQELPDFLVATVDKFAMMPWRGEAGMLFGRATHVDDQRAYGVMHDAPRGRRPCPRGSCRPS